MLLKKLLVITLILSLFVSYVPTPVFAVSPTLESFSSTGTVTGNGTTQSISLPSGVTAGDLLVACVGAAGDDTSNISADGWTHVITAGGGGTTSKIGMLYRFWQSGDSNPAVFTISTSNNLASRRGVMWRISGADATPSDATPSSNVSGASTNRVYNSITTNTNDALVLGCLNWISNDSVYTPDTDLTNTVTQNRHAADSGVQATAGVTGNFTGSGNTSQYASILWAVAPGESPINNVPTIALTSPSNAATGVSTTPTFTFTGSDDDADDLTYEIQISDNPDDFVGGEVLADNFGGGGGGSFHPQPHTTATTWQGDIQVDDRMCQSFTAVGGKWAKTVFPLGDSRVDTSGTAYARIYEHDGVFGTSSAPANAGVPADQTTAGTPTIDWLAESDGVALGASFASGDFDFAASGANQIRFQAGVNYLLCSDWIPNNNLENNTWAWSGDVLNSGTLHDGNLYHDGYSAFNHGVHADWDLHFEIYELFTLEEGDSITDAGFTNSDNGGDTSPFTTGDQISYSAQTELEEDITYYWRVRANDGTVYSSWTATRSFTTSASPSPTSTATPTPTPTSTASPTPTPTSTPTSQVASANTTSSSTSQTCTDTNPTGTPTLFQITTTDDTAKVFFTPLSNVDTYYISYATNASAEEHGINVTLGSDGVQSYTIEYLQPGTTYYFKVRGQNGCATGDWSQIISTVTTRGSGFASTILDDSLDVTELTVSLPEEEDTTKKTDVDDEKKELQNYDIVVSIMLLGKPVVGAHVELHSDPQYGTTDEHGQVLFANVERGEHKLTVYHEDYKAEQTLNVTGDSSKFNVSVTLEIKESWLPNWAWVSIVATLTAVIFIMLIKRFWNKKWTQKN